MNAAALGVDGPAPETQDSVPPGALRWAGALAAALALHAALLIGFSGQRMAGTGPADLTPPVLIDLAPPAAAGETDPSPEAAPQAAAPEPAVDLPPDVPQPTLEPPPPPVPAPGLEPPRTAPPALVNPPARPPRPTPPQPREARAEAKPKQAPVRPPDSRAGASRAAAESGARAGPSRPAASGGEAAASRASWQGALVAHLRRHLRPQSGQTGAASVRFAVDRSGRVLSASLAGSAGVPALDQEALAVFRRAEPLPPTPPDVPGASFTFTIPIRFLAR